MTFTKRAYMSQKEAITYYEKFVQDGIALGRRPETEELEEVQKYL
jgi:hypothetical protein